MFTDLPRKNQVTVGKRINYDHEYLYVARPIDDNWEDDALVSQFCVCGNCGANLISWDKHAECPKCGKYCYLT